MWSANHKLYIQFSRLLRLQSFRITLYFFAPLMVLQKIALPEYLAEDVIRNFHEQYDHFGITKVYPLMNRHGFFLRKMLLRIEGFIKSCDVCQRCKFPNRTLLGEMHPILAENPGDLVTVDYYGPLPASRSRVTYIFVTIDAFSKFARMYPVRRTQAKISAKKIVNHIHRFIPVKVVLSDHGTQLQSGHLVHLVDHLPPPVQPNQAGYERTE
jgi:hypothetical protein